jgi:hypothetical protein
MPLIQRLPGRAARGVAGDPTWPEKCEEILRRRAAKETLQSIGASMGLSKERVRQIEFLCKHRKPLPMASIRRTGQPAPITLVESSQIDALRGTLRTLMQDRAVELGRTQGTLAGSCKFGVLLAQAALGGAIDGNWDHVFLRTPKGIVDLSGPFDVAVQALGAKAYRTDRKFLSSAAFRSSLETCRARAAKYAGKGQQNKQEDLGSIELRCAQEGVDDDQFENHERVERVLGGVYAVDRQESWQKGEHYGDCYVRIPRGNLRSAVHAIQALGAEVDIVDAVHAGQGFTDEELDWAESMFFTVEGR